MTTATALRVGEMSVEACTMGKQVSVLRTFKREEAFAKIAELLPAVYACQIGEVKLLRQCTADEVPEGCFPTDEPSEMLSVSF